MVAMRRAQQAAILAAALDIGRASVPRPSATRSASSRSTVAVMTLIGRDGRPAGMTVTSMCGLSVDAPDAPRLHRPGDPDPPRPHRADRFGLDILADDQHAVAARFARRGHGQAPAEPTG